MRAVFLDRDGTITVDGGYTYRLTDFALLDGAVAGLQRLQQAGLPLFLVTNQSGIGRGYFSEADYFAFHEKLIQVLADSGITLQGSYYCPFHPQGIEPYRCASPLRKPAPGMLLQAGLEHGLDLQASFLIGDRLSDILAGQRAGCRTVLVQTGQGGRGEPDYHVEPTWYARDLAHAADLICTCLAHETESTS